MNNETSNHNIKEEIAMNIQLFLCARCGRVENEWG